VPALIALFLYALLPIVRNTLVGLRTVPGDLGRAALSLGLTPSQSLAHVQMPIALPTILAGIKTAAVINVGTATMAAFIGAGGFGERIVAGTRRQRHRDDARGRAAGGRARADRAGRLRPRRAPPDARSRRRRVRRTTGPEQGCPADAAATIEGCLSTG
jgi:hypothetical protein